MHQVQGVFFRATTAEEGQKLGLAGWVMITPSGSVKGEAQGDVDKLATFKVLKALIGQSLYADNLNSCSWTHQALA